MSELNAFESVLHSCITNLNVHLIAHYYLPDPFEYVVSGAYLVIHASLVIYEKPIFNTKMAAVSGIVVLSLFGFWQMKFTNDNNIKIRLKRLIFAGKLGFSLSLTAVYCAVYTFH